MKRLTMLVICAMMFAVGCDNKVIDDRGNRDIVVIAGCEYIQSPAYFGYTTLTHKGNCTNSIHIYDDKE